jgi:DNA-binding winged helix-turn-helix (wHTH) protein
VKGDFLVDDWLIQPQINTVEKEGKRWHLEPKVMQVLVHLASHPNEVLSKEHLIDAVWRDTFVGDDVLIRCISEIRYVFGDDPRSPSVIQTIPKAGYRLIASVSREVDATAEPVETSPRASRSNVSQDRGGEKTLEAIAVQEELHGVLSEREALPTLQEHTSAETRVGSAKDRDDNLGVRHEMRRFPEEHTSRAAPPAEDYETKRSIWSRRRTWLLFGIISTGLAVWGGTFLWRITHPSSFNIFWAPVLEAQEPVLFCIADQNQYSFITLRDAADPSRQVVLKDNLSAVVIDDLDTIVRVAGYLQAHGKEHQLKGQESTNLSDLRNGPSIFIGAFDNAWTLRLTKSLRYRFVNNADMTEFRIVDSKDPSRSPWLIDRTQQLATNNYQDYAIVARFTDANTGKPAIVIAGIGRGGTIAAGEFITNPDDLMQLVRAIQSAGNKKNLEIVLSTQIIDGQPGTPKMEASYFW